MISFSEDSISGHEHTGRDDAAWKLFVFRKSRDLLSTSVLLRELRGEIESGAAIDALVRAGEIETGLADSASPAVAGMAEVVDELATALCSENNLPVVAMLHSLEQLAAKSRFPPEIRCAHPEGFSYYGLNPLDFADLVQRIHKELRPTVAVVGIRSVGSTLGAVVAAVLRTCGKSVDRITVRPQGEPYHRNMSFDAKQLAWLRSALAQDSDFAVVDEGPGFSGSTFLSVARALVAAGVSASSIVLLGSRPFCGQNGRGEDWQKFRSYTIEYGAHTPRDAGRTLGDGAWREVIYPSPSQWPACWTHQERIKHLSLDGEVLFKFEGFGRYGHRVRNQASTLAEAGLSPRLLRFENGFAWYEFLRGRPLTPGDLTAELLSHMAAYCAFRVENFPATNSSQALLQGMLQVNLGIEFSVELTRESRPIDLPVELPVYPDCRMMPHEWFLAAPGSGNALLLKTDAVGHGDGHQLPGPADIAWDLAGAIVEWRLSTQEEEFFLEEYRRLTGDSAATRVQRYLLPYAVLSMAQSRMAAASMNRHPEGRYLHRIYKEKAMQVQFMLEYEGHPSLAGPDSPLLENSR